MLKSKTNGSSCAHGAPRLRNLVSQAPVTGHTQSRPELANDVLTTSVGAKSSFLLNSFWLYDWFLLGSGTFTNLVTANTYTVFTMCQDFTNSNS